MFSIPVSDLTPDILGRAEYWRFMQMDADQHAVAETLHRSRIEVDTSFTGWNRVSRIQWEADDWLSYDSDVRCFPVTLSPDGTETRLECPRMPDEVDIGVDWKSHKGNAWEEPPGMWVLGFASDRLPMLSSRIAPPTPEHSPRRTLEGTWVWSNRR